MTVRSTVQLDRGNAPMLLAALGLWAVALLLPAFKATGEIGSEGWVYGADAVLLSLVPAAMSVLLVGDEPWEESILRLGPLLSNMHSFAILVALGTLRLPRISSLRREVRLTIFLLVAAGSLVIGVRAILPVWLWLLPAFLFYFAFSSFRRWPKTAWMIALVLLCLALISTYNMDVTDTLTPGPGAFVWVMAQLAVVLWLVSLSRGLAATDNADAPSPTSG